MAKMTWLERRYRRSRLDYVRHITIDPRGPGVVRIHMIPPRTEDPADPFLLLLNGAQLVPLNLSWAILLANFMDQLEPWSGREIGEQDWQSMLSAAVKATRRTYPGTGKAVLLGDLELMLRSIVAIARGQEPPAEVGALSLGEYAGRDVRPPPDGPDDQRHDPGGPVALQPEVPALLRRRADPWAETPELTTDSVAGAFREAAPGQHPPGDLHRRGAHPAAGPAGAGGGGPVVRHPAEHQRPPADTGAVPQACLRPAWTACR